MKKQKLGTKFFVAAKWAFLFAILPGLIPSCKDYDDDINRLQEQIDANSTDIAGLLDLVKAGKFVQKVETTTTGIKITFSDASVVNINNGTNGTNGADGINGTNGTSPVITIGTDGSWYVNGVTTNVKAKGSDGVTPYIGADGYWYINNAKSEYQATGTAGATPYIGTNGNWFIGNTDTNVLAKGDAVTIGTNGDWFINGVDTKVIANAGNVSAVLNEDGTYYTITVTNQDKTIKSTVSIPVISQEVTSLFLVPEYMASGVPQIYVPVLTSDDNSWQITSTPNLSYRINPSGVKAGSFKVNGFDVCKATNLPLKAQSKTVPDLDDQMDLGLTQSDIIGYDAKAGVLKVRFNTNKIDVNTTKGQLFSLVVRNTLEKTIDNQFVYSNYTSVNIAPVKASSIVLGDSVAESNYQAYKGTAALPEFSITHDGSISRQLNPAAYFLRGSEYELLEEFFGIKVKYKFSYTGSDADYFDKTALESGIIRVKKSDTGNIGRVADVLIETSVNGRPVNATHVYVKVIDSRSVNPIPITIISGKQIVLGNNNFTLSFNKMDDGVYNAAGVSASIFNANATFTDEIKFEGAVTTTSGIAFIGAGSDKVNLSIPITAKTGTYDVVRTYLINGLEIRIIFNFTIKDPAVFDKRVNTTTLWSGNVELIKGNLENGKWVMTGALANGFNLAGFTVENGTDGSTMTITKKEFFSNNAGVSITNNADGTITLTNGNVGNDIPFYIRCTLSNGRFVDIPYSIRFESPIKLSSVGSITIGEYEDTKTRSPFEGVVFTKISDGTVLKSIAERSVYGLMVYGTPTLTAGKESWNNLAIDWNVANPNSPYQLGTIIWNKGASYTSIHFDANTAYDVKFKASWGQVFSANAMNVTIKALNMQ